MAVGANVVKVFLKAKTAELLVKKMRKKQAIEGRYIPFNSIQFADGFWYAWHETELKNTIINEER